MTDILLKYYKKIVLTDGESNDGSPKKNGIDPKFCNQHPANELDSFCYQCMTPICRICRSEPHHDSHPMIELDRKQFQRYIVPSYYKHIQSIPDYTNTINNFINESQTIIGQISQKHQSLESDITAEFTKIYKDLQQRERHLKSLISKEYDINLNSWSTLVPRCSSPTGFLTRSDYKNNKSSKIEPTIQYDVADLSSEKTVYSNSCYDGSRYIYISGGLFQQQQQQEESTSQTESNTILIVERFDTVTMAIDTFFSLPKEFIGKTQFFGSIYHKGFIYLFAEEIIIKINSRISSDIKIYNNSLIRKVKNDIGHENDIVNGSGKKKRISVNLSKQVTKEPF
eukprot:gene10250-12570_t